MAIFMEKTIEDYFVEKLKFEGWKFISAFDLERESLEEPLLVPNLIRALKRVNADSKIGDEEIKQVLNELKFRGSGIEDIRQILNFLKFGVPVKVGKEKIVERVKLFDYENIEKNEFLISRQVIYKSGDREIRTDILLYVNGIPLVEIECKSPVSLSENWVDAFKQIKDYEKVIPELYKYVQIGIAAEKIAKYFPIVPWQEDVKVYEWKEEMMDSIDSTIQMLSPSVLLNILKNYLLFRIEFGNVTKVIARYMQYRAAEKIVERVVKNLQGKEEKKRGLIWHWQGSGKTLIMIFTANKLHYLKELGNPTIFLIVDRSELEEQLGREFNALEVPKPEIVESVESLKEILRHDEGRGKRGFIITLIHKFRPKELNELQKELEELSEIKETILKRRNIIVFVDEGHRTQYGTMASQMNSILKNAFFFAFTGTPILKDERDTYRTFSYPPEEKYLDKYFIIDSIEDSFTVKIAYQPRLEEEHLRKESLEGFLKSDYEELPEKVREDVEEGVREKLNVIKVWLENPERIRKKAEDIAEHFKENVDGKFKALVVAASRKACIHYKRALDDFLPEEYCEVVITMSEKDEPEIQKYLKELTAKYKGKKIDDMMKDIANNKFREEELPKILIVTSMLLTGFDSPVLQTMYLDKPLKEHLLLQAVARTNRPYKDIKEAGMIIDYIGIFKEFEKAFEAYSKEDVKDVVHSIDDIRNEFVNLLGETLKLFEDIPKDKYDRGTLLKATEILTANEENSKVFLQNYKHLRKIFELLGPDEIKAKMFSEYKWLSAIYVYYTRMVLGNQMDKELLIQKYFNKTIDHIYKTTEIKNLKKDLPIIQFDEHYLRILEEKIKTKEEKAANIVFTLNKFVLVERYKNPVFESIADKVEEIFNLWKEKVKDFERIYKEGVKIIEEIKKLRERQRKLKFSDLEYSLLFIFEKEFKSEKEMVEDVKELSEKLQNYIFTDWISQSSARKGMEREIRKFIRRKYYTKFTMTQNKLNELCDRIWEAIEIYGKKT